MEIIASKINKLLKYIFELYWTNFGAIGISIGCRYVEIIIRRTSMLRKTKSFYKESQGVISI